MTEFNRGNDALAIKADRLVRELRDCHNESARHRMRSDKLINDPAHLRNRSGEGRPRQARNRPRLRSWQTRRNRPDRTRSRKEELYGQKGPEHLRP
jgi:hypothetical protein